MYSHKLVLPAGTTATAGTIPSWMTFDPSTGLLEGTPGGNDFGDWPISITASLAGKSESFSATIVVADPTLTFTPATGFTTPPFGGMSNQVTLTLAPAETYSISFGGTVTEGIGQIRKPPDTDTDAAGNATVAIVADTAGDYKGIVEVILRSNAPAGRTIRLGPIPSGT